MIDIARCLYLIEKGHNVDYKPYCDTSITPENYAIILNNMWYINSLVVKIKPLLMKYVFALIIKAKVFLLNVYLKQLFIKNFI